MKFRPQRRHPRCCSNLPCPNRCSTPSLPHSPTSRSNHCSMNSRARSRLRAGSSLDSSYSPSARPPNKLLRIERLALPSCAFSIRCSFSEDSPYGRVAPRSTELTRLRYPSHPSGGSTSPHGGIELAPWWDRPHPMVGSTSPQGGLRLAPWCDRASTATWRLEMVAAILRRHGKSHPLR